MERLRLSETKRYLETESGEPFIWVADTVWTMPQRLKWDDALYYMQTRKQQGFTVLQICALDPERDLEMRSPAGEQALIGNDPKQPNEHYFRYLDRILDMAEELGFYVLLLPVWGQLVTGDDWSGGHFARIVTDENAAAYGEYIGNRYKERTNILWCLGGDRQPIHKGVDYRPVWRSLAEGLARGLTGKDLKAGQPDPLWQSLMITYHSCYEMETGKCSTMSYWTDEEAWISFIMLQSGHGLGIRNYELVRQEYERDRTMPVWDGEPAYEEMATSWPITPETRFHGTEIVRRRAYWSLLSGAFGITYGHADVWCMISEKEKNRISRVDWYEAIHSKGSLQIPYLRSFIEQLEAFRSVPCQAILEDPDPSELCHRQAAYVLNGQAIAVYYPAAGKDTLYLKNYASDEEELYQWWYNPGDGLFYSSDGIVTKDPVSCRSQNGKLSVETPGSGAEDDWILILGKNLTSVPICQKTYYQEAGQSQEKKVFDW